MRPPTEGGRSAECSDTANSLPSRRCETVSGMPQIEGIARRAPLLDKPITIARAFLKRRAVDNCDLTAGVLDKPGRLHPVGGKGNRGALHSQNVRQEFLGKFDGLGTESILRLQYPAAQA